MPNMSIPIPPTDPNVDLIFLWVKSINTWLKNLHLNGLQATAFTQQELNAMVSANDLTQSGKFFFNTDTGKLQKSNVVSGALTITDVG